MFRGRTLSPSRLLGRLLRPARASPRPRLFPLPWMVKHRIPQFLHNSQCRPWSKHVLSLSSNLVVGTVGEYFLRMLHSILCRPACALSTVLAETKLTTIVIPSCKSSQETVCYLVFWIPELHVISIPPTGSLTYPYGAYSNPFYY